MPMDAMNQVIEHARSPLFPIKLPLMHERQKYYLPKSIFGSNFFFIFTP